MEIEFKGNEVQKICEDERFARKNFPEKIVSNLKILMYKLAATQTFSEFRNNPANKKYRIHALHGKEKELTSIELDHSYRMTVKVFVDNKKIIIWEISNHYGD